MAIKDLVTSDLPTRSSTPPSRVRSMLQALQAKLKLEPPGVLLTMLKNGIEVSPSRLLQELAAPLADFDRIDELTMQLAEQRAVIAKQVPALLELLTLANMALRIRHPKRRRRLTPKEELLAGAARKLTRVRRGTLGKRQREKLSPGRRKR